MASPADFVETTCSPGNLTELLLAKVKACTTWPGSTGEAAAGRFPEWATAIGQGPGPVSVLGQALQTSRGIKEYQKEALGLPKTLLMRANALRGERAERATAPEFGQIGEAAGPPAWVTTVGNKCPLEDSNLRPTD